MSEPATHRFDAGPWSLAVHDWGGDGPPVLLAHATGFHGRVWAPVVAELVARGRRVWSFDFHGHGDSDAPDIDYSWHGFADDVLAVARHVGVYGDPSLIAAGHSKGGASLFLAAVREPDAFARIWAFEPIVFPGYKDMTPDDVPLAVSARKRRPIFASREEAYERYASRPPMSAMTPESLHAYVDYGFRDLPDGTVALKCTPEIEARVFAMGPQHGVYERLAEVTVPVRVVCGELSQSITPALGEIIAARLVHGTFEMQPAAGHFGPQQDPAWTATSILNTGVDRPE